MSQLQNNMAWVGVIAILLLPPILVRTVEYDPFVRIVAFCVLTLAFAIFFGHFTFLRSSLASGLIFFKDIGESRRKYWDYGIRAFCAVATIGSLYLFSGILGPLTSYLNSSYGLVIETHRVGRIDSAAMPAAFYIHMSVTTETGAQLSYWYPDQILQGGDLYEFTLLPGSNFVVSAKNLGK